MAAKKNKEAEEAEKAAAEQAAGDQSAPDADAPKPPAKVAEKAKGKLIELKDKETGFFDRATGFQVVRDQKVELGDTIGDATREALQSGRLLIVSEK